MIYQYEAKVLEFINAMVPEIMESTYANADSMFLAMNDIQRYPAFRYSRNATNYEWSQSIECREGESYHKMYPVEQHYVGRIYLENANYAFRVLTALKFGWAEKAKVQVNVEGEVIDVSLWLLYIKIDEERSPADKQGTRRFVEFSWKSNLILTKDFSDKYKLVKGYKFILVAKGVALLNEKDEILEVY